MSRTSRTTWSRPASSNGGSPAMPLSSRANDRLALRTERLVLGEVGRLAGDGHRVTLGQLAVVHPVDEIQDDRAEDVPAEEDQHPVLDREDQSEAGEDAEAGDHRVKRHSIAARDIGVGP